MTAPQRHKRARALPPPTARLLRRVEAAAYVGLSPTSFDRAVEDGVMPGPKRVYRTIRGWDVLALDRAIDALPGGDADVNPWD